MKIYYKFDVGILSYNCNDLCRYCTINQVSKKDLHVVKSKYYFISILVILSTILSYIGYERYQYNVVLPFYSQELLLSEATQERNKPLINELFRLGEIVGDLKEVKSSTIDNTEQKEAHILLSKICRDSCLPVRCRLDPGLGHACRVNCPTRKIRFCITTLKPLKANS